MGSLGDAGCFSFYPTKIITSGTGGMISTSDPGLEEYARQTRIFGKVLEGGNKGEIIRFGNDWFLDEIRCCVAKHQLGLLDEILAGRRAVAARYRQALEGVPGISLLEQPQGLDFSYYQFPVFLDPGPDPASRRDSLAKALKDKHGVEAKAIYKPTHRETAFRVYDNGSLSRTEDTLDRSLCLPVYLGMTDQEFETVVNGLRAELESPA